MMPGGLGPEVFGGIFPREYLDYTTQYPGQKEIVQWLWYDTVTYTSASTTSIDLFTATRSTLDLSNMVQAGQFPGGTGFLLRVPRFFLKGRPRAIARAASTNPNTGSVDNIAQLINTGVATLIVGQKRYLQVPLYLLPSGGGAWGTIAVEGATVDPGAAIDYGVNGVPDVRNAFTLSRPLFFPPLVNFVWTLTWPTAITLAGGDHTIQILMDGDNVRNVQ